MQQPTQGRIVIYKNLNGEVYPAIITKVEGENISLTLFKVRDEEYPETAIRNMAAGPREAQNGQWWWQERV